MYLAPSPNRGNMSSFDWQEHQAILERDDPITPILTNQPPRKEPITMTAPLIWDIETGPLPDEQLLALADPFDESKFPHPGEFDPATVKTGNMKDETKIQAKIDAAREAHEKAVAEHDTNLAAARDAWWAGVLDEASLSAVTGQVLAIGYLNPDSNKAAIDWQDGDAEGEAGLLRRFWAKYESCKAGRRHLIGLNIRGFDLPFLRQRSFILGVDVPADVIRQERYWHDTFVDLRDIWLSGLPWAKCKSNFDHLGKVFGTGGKNQGCDGSEFARLYVEDRAAAEAYLINDLRQPAVWAERMGVC